MDEKAQQAFEHLKTVMISAPVLAMPDFSKPFVIETNASGMGIGAALMQEGYPVAYFSKALAQKHHSLSAYEKELMAVVVAVEKWRPYLLGRHFVIKVEKWRPYLLVRRFIVKVEKVKNFVIISHQS